MQTTSHSAEQTPLNANHPIERTLMFNAAANTICNLHFAVRNLQSPLRRQTQSAVKHLAVATLLAASLAAAASAQDASLLQEPSADPQGLSLQASSFMHRELPPESRPRTLQKNDIITVIVDYRTRMLSEGDAEARKTSSLLAVLTDWIKFDGKSVKPAPQSDGDPSIGGTYNSQYRAESDVELRDSLNFRIAAKIVDIRPNGNLVLEAHWDIRKQRRTLANLPYRRHSTRSNSARPDGYDRSDLRTADC